MRIVVCVKYVPVLSALRFDAETRRLVREGVPGEVSGFDQRALGAATALRERHGGEVVAVTMGPLAAKDGLVVCMALGADRAVHVLDPALAGSDTLATARALAAVVRRETPDLVLMGRASTDAETGQVGPEVAELLDLPQATGVRRIAIDPAARTFEAERETDDGFETLAGPLPALVTAAEDIAEERFPNKAARQAAAEKPIETLSLAALGVDAADVGAAGSPTWVAGVEQVEIARRAEILEATGDAGELAARLRARLRELGALDVGGDDRPILPRRHAVTARRSGSSSRRTPPGASATSRSSCSARPPSWVRGSARRSRPSSSERARMQARSPRRAPIGCSSPTIRRSRRTRPTRTRPCSPPPSAPVRRVSCCSGRRRSGAISRRASRDGSASGSRATRSTSSSTPRVARAR
jgi:electron transfer flavoprotein alpha/beta subunit